MLERAFGSDQPSSTSVLFSMYFWIPVDNWLRADSKTGMKTEGFFLNLTPISAFLFIQGAVQNYGK